MWRLIGLSLGMFTKLRPKDPHDPYQIVYAFARYAKYAGFITGSYFLFDALRSLIRLLN